MQKSLSRVLILFGVLVLSSTQIFAAARRPMSSALIVAPSRFTVLQVAFDIVARENATLVSFQGEPGDQAPALHVWSAGEWIPVDFESFSQGSFLNRTPTVAIVIGNDEIVPDSIVPAISWCPAIVRFNELDAVSMVSGYGKVFNFSDQDWRWFSKRYNLEVVDVNSEARNRNWYDTPYGTRVDMLKNAPGSSAPAVEPEAPREDLAPTHTRVIQLPPPVEEGEQIAEPALEEPALEEPAPALMMEETFIK